MILQLARVFCVRRFRARTLGSRTLRRGHIQHCCCRPLCRRLIRIRIVAPSSPSIEISGTTNIAPSHTASTLTHVHSAISLSHDQSNRRRRSSSSNRCEWFNGRSRRIKINSEYVDAVVESEPTNTVNSPAKDYRCLSTLASTYCRNHAVQSHNINYSPSRTYFYHSPPVLGSCETLFRISHPTLTPAAAGAGTAAPA